MEILENGSVKIDFTKSSGRYSYSDALIFTQEEYATLTEDQIEAMKQARFDKWYAIVTYVPTAEEIAAAQAEAEAQALLDGQTS